MFESIIDLSHNLYYFLIKRRCRDKLEAGLYSYRTDKGKQNSFCGISSDAASFGTPLGAKMYPINAMIKTSALVRQHLLKRLMVAEQSFAYPKNLRL